MGHEILRFKKVPLSHVGYSAFKFYNPLTAGAAYIRVLIFYSQIKYHIIKIKCDINQQDLKRVDFHFVKSV